MTQVSDVAPGPLVLNNEILTLLKLRKSVIKALFHFKVDFGINLNQETNYFAYAFFLLKHFLHFLL
jgi:hypothetical protein